MPRIRVATVDGSQVSASQPLIACRLSSSRIAGRSRVTSYWLKGANALAVLLDGPERLAGRPQVPTKRDGSRYCSRIGTGEGHQGSGSAGHHASSLVSFLARLGCTRIGSPGIFGEQTL